MTKTERSPFAEVNRNLVEILKDLDQRKIHMGKAPAWGLPERRQFDDRHAKIMAELVATQRKLIDSLTVDEVQEATRRYLFDVEALPVSYYARNMVTVGDIASSVEAQLGWRSGDATLDRAILSKVRRGLDTLCSEGTVVAMRNGQIGRRVHGHSNKVWVYGTPRLIASLQEYAAAEANRIADLVARQTRAIDHMVELGLGHWVTEGEIRRSGNQQVAFTVEALEALLKLAAQAASS